MSLFRVVLLWAVMLAVPFQGYAAASMLGCAPASPTAAVPVAHAAHSADVAHAADAADVAHAAAAAPDHPADGHHAAHAASPAGAQDPHGHASTHGDASAHGDAAHKCGTCGTCHAVALIAMPTLHVPDALPPADLAEPARHVATLALRVPDKPPRA